LLRETLAAIANVAEASILIDERSMVRAWRLFDIKAAIEASSGISDLGLLSVKEWYSSDAIGNGVDWCEADWGWERTVGWRDRQEGREADGERGTAGALGGRID
jgi:hypothetical protein